MAEDSKAYIGPDWYFDHDAGTTDLNIGHETDGIDYLSLNSGGPVEVKNANLNVNDNNITNINELVTSTGEPSNLHLNGVGSEFRVFDGVNTQQLFRVSEGGPVEVLNSNLQMNGNEIDDVFMISSSPTTGGTNGIWDVVFNGTGSDYDIRYDGTKYFKIAQGGPVEVLNANLNVGQIHWVNSNNNSDYRTYTSGGTWKLEDAVNSTVQLTATQGGPVEVLNSELQVVGNTHTTSYGNNSITWTDGAQIYEDSNGEIDAVDSAGNVTQLT